MEQPTVKNEYVDLFEVDSTLMGDLQGAAGSVYVLGKLKEEEEKIKEAKKMLTQRVEAWTDNKLAQVQQQREWHENNIKTFLATSNQKKVSTHNGTAYIRTTKELQIPTEELLPLAKEKAPQFVKTVVKEVLDTREFKSWLMKNETNFPVVTKETVVVRRQDELQD